LIHEHQQSQANKRAQLRHHQLVQKQLQAPLKQLPQSAPAAAFVKQPPQSAPKTLVYNAHSAPTDVIDNLQLSLHQIFQHNAPAKDSSIYRHEKSSDYRTEGSAFSTKNRADTPAPTPAPALAKALVITSVNTPAPASSTGSATSSATASVNTPAPASGTSSATTSTSAITSATAYNKVTDSLTINVLLLTSNATSVSSIQQAGQKEKDVIRDNSGLVNSTVNNGGSPQQLASTPRKLDTSLIVHDVNQLQLQQFVNAPSRYPFDPGGSTLFNTLTEGSEQSSFKLGQPDRAPKPHRASHPDRALKPDRAPHPDRAPNAVVPKLSRAYYGIVTDSLISWDIDPPHEHSFKLRQPDRARYPNRAPNPDRAPNAVASKLSQAYHGSVTDSLISHAVDPNHCNVNPPQYVINSYYHHPFDPGGLFIQLQLQLQLVTEPFDPGRLFTQLQLQLQLQLVTELISSYWVIYQLLGIAYAWSKDPLPVDN